MNKALPLATVLISTFMFLFFTIGSSIKASDEEAVHKLIETATTSEDHIKIAEYYEKQAVGAERKSSFHASMADAYKKRGKPLTGLAKHCENLAKNYTEVAQEYKAMATEHREMAKEKK